MSTADTEATLLQKYQECAFLWLREGGVRNSYFFTRGYRDLVQLGATQTKPKTTIHQKGVIEK